MVPMLQVMVTLTTGGVEVGAQMPLDAVTLVTENGALATSASVSTTPWGGGWPEVVDKDLARAVRAGGGRVVRLALLGHGQVRIAGHGEIVASAELFAGFVSDWFAIETVAEFVAVFEA